MRIVQEIVGKEVLDSSAVVIGKVRDVEVNFMTNEIEAFIVGKGGISEGLGLSKGEIQARPGKYGHPPPAPVRARRGCWSKSR